ncbi:hypothetical protein EYZ11_000323 [Aspergillus tanneri]|uniref:Uncharacterized protein n=1 Tax=Aspergillus tanneri TaxID=1220188 RepID=A0A4S3JX79_9EURO|nr:hypothetical protein EYZ11_000323 [Aspergillus tanneri]
MADIASIYWNHRLWKEAEELEEQHVESGPHWKSNIAIGKL